MDAPQPPVGPQEFKPNIYPVMYWGLAYGLIAGLLLLAIYLLSSFITIVWFPVFLAGLVWGGFRNYKKQKAAWASSQGVSVGVGSPVQEFREAVGDIMTASQELMSEETPANENEAAQPEPEVPQEEIYPDQENPPTPPNIPTAPPPPPRTVN